MRQVRVCVQTKQGDKILLLLILIIIMIFRRKMERERVQER